MPASNPDDTETVAPLLRQASRAAFWNAVFLPVIAVVNLCLAVVIRRSFGLLSGVYDVLLGLSEALLHYSSAGIPTSLTKLIPEVGSMRGIVGLKRFLWRAALVRLLSLCLCLLFLNFFRETIATQLGLGTDGKLYLQLLTGLVFARAVIALCSKVLYAFFAQRSANALALLQAVLDIGLVGAGLMLGYGMVGVMISLVLSGGVVMFASMAAIASRLRLMGEEGLEEHRANKSLEIEHSIVGFARFSSFTYLLELSLFFVGMGFAAPALALVLAPESVALFATAFKLSFMTVGLAVSGFRGLYRPLFARLRIRNDTEQLQRAYGLVSKAQLVVLFPAGIGLIVMSGDYIPLLFGQEFLSSVPIAWVLVGFMYAETAFNLPVIILFVDEQYRAVFWAQALTILLAPVFVLAASGLGLVVAASVFGAARLASALLSYAFCRQLYGLRFPWAFAGRVGRVSITMGVVLALVRTFWPTSPIEAVTLTLVGVLLFGVGMRQTEVLSGDEVDVLRRSGVPGNAWVLSLLAPHALGKPRAEQGS